ncbi:MAG TPA: efflux RND transporter periplasmic adaptor subunit [Terriglobia bacterium]|nr:efflux RND transporter periplasmic adaptor subunit [Terriglobia bacterium]
MSRLKTGLWLLVLAGVVSAAVYLYARSGGDGSAAYLTTAVDQGSIRNVVNATGVVQTLVTVQVGSQVSGQVLELHADFNSMVKRGQLLAKLDPRTFDAQVENSRANVTAAQARVRNAEVEIKTNAANVLSAKANLEAARVAKDNSATIFQRSQELDRKGLISRNDYDTSKANADSAAAKYEQAAASLVQVEAQSASAAAGVEQARAQLDQAQADLERARLNLEYTNIYSPVDGVVISRSIDVGQTLAASMQAPTLFTIANDLGRMQVNASVDEADIGNISSADNVKFTVDAYPGETFNARISEIRLSPQTVQNVVTYSVILMIDNRAMKLRPGMTANITFIVDERDDVLRIPNAALRYAPEGQQNGGRGRRGSRGGDANGANPAQTGNPAPAPGAETVQAAAPGEGGAPGGERNPGSGRGSGRRGGGGRGNAFAEGSAADWNNGADAGAGAAGDNPVPAQTATTRAAGGQLAPGQLWDPSDKMRFVAPKKRVEKPGTVWILNAQQKPEARQITTGITDGSFSELIQGDLKPGDLLITGDNIATAQRQQNTTTIPFLQQNRGGGRRGGGF